MTDYSINGVNIRNRINHNDLRNGEVLKCGIDNEPLLFHYGIVIKENNKTLIAHNPFVGESILLEDADAFFDNRYIITNHGVLTTKNAKELIIKFNEIKHKKYNLLTYNCEDFVNEMIEKPLFFYRGKVLFFSTLALLSFLAYKYISNKSKKAELQLSN